MFVVLGPVIDLLKLFIYIAPGDSHFLFLASWYLPSPHLLPFLQYHLEANTMGRFFILPVCGHVLNVRVHCTLKVRYTGAHKEDQGPVALGHPGTRHQAWCKDSNLGSEKAAVCCICPGNSFHDSD